MRVNVLFPFLWTEQGCRGNSNVTLKFQITLGQIFFFPLYYSLFPHFIILLGFYLLGNVSGPGLGNTGGAENTE